MQKKYIDHIKKRDDIKIETLPQGGLKIKGVTLQKAGVYKYGDTSEYKPKELITSDEFINSIVGIPITIEHPKEGFVNSTNYKKHASGSVFNAYKHGDDEVRGDIIINDETAVQKIKNDGFKFSSLGMIASEKQESGVYNGQEYSKIHTSAHPNHLALTTSPKLGEVMRFINESNDSENIEIISENILAQHENITNDKNIINNSVMSTDIQNEELKKQLADAQTELQKLKEEKTHRESVEMKEKLESEKKEILEKAKAEALKEFQERQDVITKCESLGFKCESNLSTSELKAAFLKEKMPSVKLESSEESYLNGVFEAMYQNLSMQAKKESSNDTMDFIRGIKNESVDPMKVIAKAINKQIDDMRSKL